MLGTSSETPILDHILLSYVVSPQFCAAFSQHACVTTGSTSGSLVARFTESGNMKHCSKVQVVLALSVLICHGSVSCDVLQARRSLHGAVSHKAGDLFLHPFKGHSTSSSVTHGITVTFAAGAPSSGGTSNNAKAGTKTDSSKGSSVSGAMDSATLACIKSVAEGNAGMRALSWMVFTMYACAASNDDGCTALLSAGQVPFKSEDDISRMLEEAAASVKACAATTGRGLKAWGADLVQADPAVDIAALERICKNAAPLAKSGLTLPELDDFGLTDTFAAIGVGASQSYLAIFVGVGWTKNPLATFGTNIGIGAVFGKLFYSQNEADCRELYSDQGCAELSNPETWRALNPATGTESYGLPLTAADFGTRSADAAVLAWGKSDACKACSKELMTVCLNHVSEYNKKFKQVATMSNAVGLMSGAWARLGLAAAAGASESEVLKKALMASVVQPIWQSWRIGQAAIGHPDWAKETLLNALRTALKWQERMGVPKEPQVRTPLPATWEPAQPRVAPTTPVPHPTPAQPRVQPSEPRSTPAATTPASASANTYTATVGGTTQRFALCPCESPSCNAPAGGGQGVRRADSNDCVNCFESYPCPPSMKCTQGTFSVCV